MLDRRILDCCQFCCSIAYVLQHRLYDTTQHCVSEITLFYFYCLLFSEMLQHDITLALAAQPFVANVVTTVQFNFKPPGLESTQLYRAKMQTRKAFT
jgi:hypothetical protein